MKKADKWEWLNQIQEAMAKVRDCGVYGELEVLLDNGKFRVLKNKYNGQIAICGMNAKFVDLPDDMYFVIRQTESKIDYEEKYFELLRRIKELLTLDVMADKKEEETNNG